MSQEELIQLMQERRAEEEERNKLTPEDRAELARIEAQKRMIEENRRRMAEAYAAQIHDREIAAMTQDMEPDAPAPADEELAVHRYEPLDAAQVQSI